MTSLFLAFVYLYVFVVSVLGSSRTIKILDLYDEYQIVRAREQKSHIKTHAIALAADYKSDLMWPITFSKKIKPVLAWIRAK